MGSHPMNLAVRFFLEVAALAAMGFWGWNQGVGVLRFVLALGIPLIAAVVWGTFAVPHDPSRSGQAPIPVPGMLRLALEMLFFACALWALSNSGATTPSWILGSVILVHYALSYDRVFWLFTQ
jgi:Protein of unknown function (DUF2568)